MVVIELAEETRRQTVQDPKDPAAFVELFSESWRGEERTDFLLLTNNYLNPILYLVT